MICFLQYPAMNAVYNASEPGIGMEAAKWLADQKVVADRLRYVRRRSVAV